MPTPTEWKADQWEAEYYAPYLCLTAPDGASGLVLLRQNGRNVTLSQFRASVKSHGIKRACEVFWKLRARDATEAESRDRCRDLEKPALTLKGYPRCPIPTALAGCPPASCKTRRLLSGRKSWI